MIQIPSEKQLEEEDKKYIEDEGEESSEEFFLTAQPPKFSDMRGSDGADFW